ncbi:uncharacterized protein LOC124368143 [Homalodisca vitripennis]|uniref:uncharacterized protein LOC124368143 n=1 Tax=Homalodisca vitripennis TaxID=197043 RepID=UPI001EEABBEF|nr:uncharacterized protein LOC124368143 [Homalodisca vitripennis]
MPVPTTETWKEIANNFSQRANFPHCTGAVDGKHIRIVHPCNSMYYNYKGFSSIVLMAVADSQYRFIYVGSYGKDSHSTIFQNCSLWQALLNGTMGLPEEECPQGTKNPKVPYAFVADEAFGLHKNLLRPFSGHNLTVGKRVFNYRLSRARRYIGILTNKWRIFHRPLNLDPEFCAEIVKACVILHNFVIVRNGYNTEDALTVTGLESLPRSESVRTGLSANNVRKIMTDYFLTPVGSVKW